MSDFQVTMIVLGVVAVAAYLPDIIRAWRGKAD
jgi:hypothetical protein